MLFQDTSKRKAFTRNIITLDKNSSPGAGERIGGKISCLFPLNRVCREENRGRGLRGSAGPAAPPLPRRGRGAAAGGGKERAQARAGACAPRGDPAGGRGLRQPGGPGRAGPHTRGRGRAALPAGRGGWSAPAAAAGTPSGRCRRSPRRPPGCSRSRGDRRGPGRAAAAAARCRPRGSRCRRAEAAGGRRRSPAPGAPAPAAPGRRPASPLEAESTARGQGRPRRQGRQRRAEPPTPPTPGAPSVPAFPECLHPLSLGAFTSPQGSLETGMRPPALPLWPDPPAGPRRPGSIPRLLTLFIAFFRIEKRQMIPEIYRGGYAMLFLCNCWSYCSSRFCIGKKLFWLT